MTASKPVWEVRSRPAPVGLFTALILFFIVGSRWALAPQYVYYFDSANFALSLEEFNPLLHQPQPPGYPLFVGLIRLIHLWVARPEQVLLIAGLVAACASVMLIRLLAAELFGTVAGILSMALLASNPVFWFGGLTNQIRLFLALSAIAIALLSWRALTRPLSAAWLYAAFAALGIAGGFRPELPVLLFPLLLWVWFRTGHSLQRLAIGLLSFGAASLPSVVVLAIAVGGARAMLHMVAAYSDQQFSGSSALFGAGTASAVHMFAMAVVWNMLGTVPWFWALPFARRKLGELFPPLKITFLLLWFFPIFLFSAFVHIGDPDQALGSIPVLSIAGGATLSILMGKPNRRRVLLVSVALVAAHTVLFFKPPTKLAKAASYKTVAAVDRTVSDAMAAIRALRVGGPVTIVYYGSPVTSRQLFYYFPDDYVAVLPGFPGHTGAGWPTEGFHHKMLPIPAGVDALLRPGSRRVLCLLPPGSPSSSLPGWRPLGPIFYTEVSPGQELVIGPYHLRSIRM